MDPFVWFLFLLVVIASSHYIYQVVQSKIGNTPRETVQLDVEEGFENIEETVRTTKEGELSP